MSENQNQNKLIGYLEEDKPVLLKYGKYGYFLLCSNKCYSVPQKFGPAEEIDIFQAEKIITWKDNLTVEQTTLYNDLHFNKELKDK